MKIFQHFFITRCSMILTFLLFSINVITVYAQIIKDRVFELKRKPGTVGEFTDNFIVEGTAYN